MLCARLAHRGLHRSLSFVRDEAGQDLVEYALLTATIGLAGLTALSLLRTTMGTSYGSWTGAVYGLWETPAPTGS